MVYGEMKANRGAPRGAEAAIGHRVPDIVTIENTHQN